MVFVLILKEKGEKENCPKLERLFDDCNFDWMELSFKNSSRNKQVREALRRGREITNGPLLVISSKMVTMCTSTRIKSMINGGLSIIAGDDDCLDMLYLAKHNDYCQKLRPTSSEKYHKTYHPCGLDAVIFTPTGIAKVLGDEPLIDNIYMYEEDDLEEEIPDLIHDGYLAAVATYIDIFEYDIHHHSHSACDYKKWNKCAPLQRKPQKIETTGISGIVYISLIIIIILIVAWALLYIGPRG